MGWLRTRRYGGVVLALLALVLKLALAFGHHHFDLAHAHGVTPQHDHIAALIYDGGASDHAHHHGDDAPCPVHSDSAAHATDNATGHDHQHDRDHLAQVCFDCLTLAAASMTAQTPALKQHQAVSLSHYVQDNNTAHPVHHHTAFRSRAPPHLAQPA